MASAITMMNNMVIQPYRSTISAASGSILATAGTELFRIMILRSEWSFLFCWMSWSSWTIIPSIAKHFILKPVSGLDNGENEDNNSAAVIIFP